MPELRFKLKLTFFIKLRVSVLFQYTTSSHSGGLPKLQNDKTKKSYACYGASVNTHEKEFV